MIVERDKMLRDGTWNTADERLATEERLLRRQLRPRIALLRRKPYKNTARRHSSPVRGVRPIVGQSRACPTVTTPGVALILGRGAPNGERDGEKPWAETIGREACCFGRALLNRANPQSLSLARLLPTHQTNWSPFVMRLRQGNAIW